MWVVAMNEALDLQLLSAEDERQTNAATTGAQAGEGLGEVNRLPRRGSGQTPLTDMDLTLLDILLTLL